MPVCGEGRVPYALAAAGPAVIVATSDVLGYRPQMSSTRLENTMKILSRSAIGRLGRVWRAADMVGLSTSPRPRIASFFSRYSCIGRISPP